jgi:hypothetical protein
MEFFFRDKKMPQLRAPSQGSQSLALSLQQQQQQQQQTDIYQLLHEPAARMGIILPFCSLGVWWWAVLFVLNFLFLHSHIFTKRQDENAQENKTKSGHHFS